MPLIVRAFLLSLIALALSAASAQAAVTSSNVTSPGDRFQALIDLNAAVPETIVVTGTSNGTTGDTVDVVCTWDTSSSTLVSDLPVSADGTFGGSGELQAIDDNTCRLRAVPDENDTRGLHRFTGPRVAISNRFVSTLSGGPNDDLDVEYDVNANNFQGYWQLNSYSGGSIDDGSPYGLPAFDDEAGSWDDGGDLDAFPNRDDRSSVVVDGNNAYGPEAAVNLFLGAQDTPGLEGLSFSTSFDPATGNLTITESANLVRCPSNVLPPDGLSCPNYLSTGVRLDRTHVVRFGSLQDRITDTFVSTDGAQHSINLLYENDAEESETGWLLPPYDRFMRFGNGDSLSAAELPAAPFTLVAKEGDDEPDGSPESGVGGITFAASPDSLNWLQDDQMEAQYSRTVPAGGSTVIGQTYSQGFYVAEVVDLGRLAEEFYAPPQVTIPEEPTTPIAPGNVAPDTTITAKPKDNLKLKKGAKKVTVTYRFASSDLNSTFECKIDENAFRSCTSPQSYKLAKGTHTFEVRATDDGGLVDATPAKDEFKVKKAKKKK